jgi:hypothetical protein
MFLHHSRKNDAGGTAFHLIGLTKKSRSMLTVSDGSRKGSIGNAVSASSRNAAAAPATVSGESKTD